MDEKNTLTPVKATRPYNPRNRITLLSKKTPNFFLHSKSNTRVSDCNATPFVSHASTTESIGSKRPEFCQRLAHILKSSVVSQKSTRIYNRLSLFTVQNDMFRSYSINSLIVRSAELLQSNTTT